MWLSAVCKLSVRLCGMFEPISFPVTILILMPILILILQPELQLIILVLTSVDKTSILRQTVYTFMTSLPFFSHDTNKCFSFFLSALSSIVCLPPHARWFSTTPMVFSYQSVVLIVFKIACLTSTFS